MRSKNYTIRPFKPTNEEYAKFVSMHNQINRFTQDTAADWQHWDKHRAPDRLFQRSVVERDGQLVGYGFSARLDSAVNRFHLGVFLLPQHQSNRLINDFYIYLINHCQKYAPVGFISKAREDESAKTAWLTRNGFQPVMRYPLSTLNVPAFDPAPYAGLFGKMTEQGVAIVSLPELMSRDTGWKKQIYDLDVSVTRDTPSPHPYIHPPFHLYAQQKFDGPNFMPEDWFLALADGQCVGMTNGRHIDEKGEMMQTHFTGVLRAYRRRGIALALKVRSILYAQSLGTRLIITNNEENNPMYQINLALGFQPQPADIDWERVEEAII